MWMILKVNCLYDAINYLSRQLGSSTDTVLLTSLLETLKLFDITQWTIRCLPTEETLFNESSSNCLSSAELSVDHIIHVRARL